MGDNTSVTLSIHRTRTFPGTGTGSDTDFHNWYPNIHPCPWMKNVDSVLSIDRRTNFVFDISYMAYRTSCFTHAMLSVFTHPLLRFFLQGRFWVGGCVMVPQICTLNGAVLCCAV